MRDQIIDDAPGGGLQFSGNWQHQTGLQPAYAGTISTSEAKDATAEAHVRGKRILLFCKLGADCGMVSISIDGGAAETIDTYDADDLWGAGIYQKQLADGGEHTVRITVLGTKNPRASKALINIDGIRGEAD
jgi:hypothetical protein